MFQPPLAAPADADANAPRAVVLPAPDAAGLLPTLDGRKQRVPDPARLVKAINDQPIEVRVDTDHQSEPISPTFRGSTHAYYGWPRDFRAAASGAISAAFHLTDVGAALLRSRAYRYLSPALRDGAQRRSVGRGRRLLPAASSDRVLAQFEITSVLICRAGGAAPQPAESA